jgi:hypothetical protein
MEGQPISIIRAVDAPGVAKVESCPHGCGEHMMSATGGPSGWAVSQALGLPA